MKIFITGGNGFLGNALQAILNNSSKYTKMDSPSSSECNLFDQNSLDQFNNIKYDFIVHLAAWTQAGKFCLDYPADQWINNQKINTNIIDWWIKNQKQAKFIFIGTSCAYDPNEKHVEDKYLIGEPTESLYTYAMTKRMLFQAVRAAELQYDLKWLGLVPSTLYGPDYHLDGRQMHFIFDLIRKILLAKHESIDAVLWGDGNQRRELIHTSDFVRVMLKLMHEVDNELINIGGGTDYSIKEFAEIICDVSNTNIKLVKYDENEYVGARNKKLEIQKITNIIPDYLNNLTPISDGINEVVVWFEKNKYFYNQDIKK